MKLEIEWDSSDSSRRGLPYNRKASTIHGWVTKMRGTLLDNESVRRRGIREMKDAKAIREYKRKRAAERRARGQSSSLFSFGCFGGSSSRQRSKKHGSRPVMRRDTSSRSQSRKKSEEPFLHFPHRAKPPHHGHGTRVAGHITGNKVLVAKGRAMNEQAMEERERERQRRERQKRRDLHAMKQDLLSDECV
ncbi:hypothetical protein PHLCEN_2v1556 [Hermanssonia centrifuga]|uniref:Uncharacterized protein n=1 Tax=Hermanssonia centrifuga TaxID=98765 RepID=A0A2R6RZF1_9APHY|nr:hypothetical protein PHLCEN_2v1556 [Hermanssonia centrifuga]